MNKKQSEQFYGMYSVLAILLQRNDKTGALINAELHNHGVSLGDCYKTYVQSLQQKHAAGAQGACPVCPQDEDNRFCSYCGRDLRAA